MIIKLGEKKKESFYNCSCGRIVKREDIMCRDCKEDTHPNKRDMYNWKTRKICYCRGCL